MLKFKKYALENGDYYKGSYDDHGRRHGSGHYLFTNGAQYIGTYRRGLRHGFGKFIYPDHTIYEGDWIQNVKHGRGKYAYRNGDYYDGEWSMDKRHGLGTYYRATLNCTLHGIWQNGYRNGPAELKFGDYRFYGVWSGERCIGMGTFTVPTKIVCSGSYAYNYENVNDDKGISIAWTTTQINVYDTTQLPQSPGDYHANFGVPPSNNVDILRTVSEVDYTTDYLIDRTIFKKDINNMTDTLLQNAFTVTEIRDITETILKYAVSHNRAESLNDEESQIDAESSQNSQRSQ